MRPQGPSHRALAVGHKARATKRTADLAEGATGGGPRGRLKNPQRLALALELGQSCV